VRLLVGARQRHQDLFAGRSPRPFHYLLVEVGSTGLVVSARGVGHGEQQARVLDRFEIPFVR
jgi:hypothetical protein